MSVHVRAVVALSATQCHDGDVRSTRRYPVLDHNEKLQTTHHLLVQSITGVSWNAPFIAVVEEKFTGVSDAPMEYLFS